MRILHVAIADDWEACRQFGEYSVSTRHKTFDDVGFIHASTARQLRGTVDRVFGDLGLPLVVAVIDLDALAADGIEVRWEASDDEVFPHIYSPIPMDAPTVVAELHALRGPDGYVLPDVSAYDVVEEAPRLG
ncbi:DUF952 domain-containing protein [Compostimonas suwonensis]|uniref:Uncharacterized protein (DUF952 family) n=1 Tax=Compostimonas suwonensis TaxID=1048394 RepID=A0A2M9C4S1_9MICO|nr:DUF952 domain-containing protein [Compostimonas suwonensis]PJJ65525.1 uncharacterized protein (DUF952 family) [Compostimonas suwonensis]